MKTKVTKILNWLGARLKERSTWLGIATLATSLGVFITPELTEYIITIGTAIGGLVFFVTSDQKPETDDSKIDKIKNSIEEKLKSTIEEAIKNKLKK